MATEPTTELRLKLEAALGVPFLGGNRIDVLRNGDEIFPAMLGAIDEAKSSIDFVTFVYWQGDIAVRFAEALAAAARRGVQVRALLDGIGARTMDRTLIRRMKDAGVRVVWFRPVRWLSVPWRMASRTHRKVLVCDDAVGFTGGVGIGAEWEGDASAPGSWRETHFRVTGPAVTALRAAFLEDWLEAADDVSPPRAEESQSAQGDLDILVVRSSGGYGWSNRATLLWTLIGEAERSIRISTPYFVPSPETSRHFVEARARGVEISVLVPGPYVDKRIAQVAGESSYAELLDAGVRILEYQTTMIHQKISVYDSAYVAIGSSNLNHRSRLQDHELELVVADRGFAAEIDEMLDEDFADGVPVDPRRWANRGLGQRIAELALRPFRRQM